METSRIFIRGLPPTITDAELRKHFSAGNREVTDVKAIQQRRIGYVGFKTPEDAKKAVKYFHRSFIRMSRLSVVLAKPIGDPALQKTISHPQQPSKTYSNERKPSTQPPQDAATAESKKRKRDEVDESDPKLQEYLQVFQHGKGLADEIAETLTPAAVAEKKKLLEEGESDDEYELIPTRPEKKQMRQAPHDQPEKLSREDDSMAVDKEPEANGAGTEPETEVQPDPAPEANVAATDDDWLRSRTNRLLDLVDEDEMPPPLPKNTDDQVVEPEVKGDQVDPQSELQTQEPEASIADVPGDVEKDGEDASIATIRKTARLFARNLPYTAAEPDLREHFEQFGEVQEVHIPVTKSGSSKGFALILFTSADSAVAAFQSLDGQTFQGRLLHILPAAGKRDIGADEFELSKLPLKKQNLIRKKAEAASTFNWNSLYMSQDAVNASVASRLGVSKSELLDPTDASAAVKQAVAESTIINETKRFFVANGVDLNAFKSHKRGDTCILVKNFPHGTTIEELRNMFEEHGTVLQVLMPPSGTIAIVQYAQPAQGRAAFKKLAYRRIKDSVLFLEKGPIDLFKNDHVPQVNQPEDKQQQPSGIQKLSVTELLERGGDDEEEEAESHSVFVGNLNFSTRSGGLVEKFGGLEGFVSAQVKTKTDPKRPGQVLSMGFGFVEFRTKEQAQAAVKAMNGFVLDGHALAVKASHRGRDAAEERRREDATKKKAGQRTKIIIKNLPFEATKKDIRSLFGTYGQLRAVRVPKKFGQTSRGFAFAEFVTPREAENARAALENTHLLGRRLVLEFAEAEAVDAEEEIEKMQKKVGGQVNKVAFAQLTGRTRKKVNIGDQGDEFDV
ncbi:RNA-binding domain-containing protein [Sodiomyces alkalinus F11]|uniref:Multiple RNA-binding domain-containing protein 1 n=1 Tax=Sodiomyces alkalinus (strain CBS 110278 / VKM F-3762 / F11) TaxID=1314773 RepID=A0A3N2Q6A0_SODAK|nr:RNA-binding domain-containing protein [Sodiomyces alkalinus F11]ROT42270.1 RNA-binding domain-containing protein [Sodiomyces alkalinus F11]